jgi:hypothetical protein
MGFVYDDFEILGAFTAPEKFQRYVEKRFNLNTMFPRLGIACSPWSARRRL